MKKLVAGLAALLFTTLIGACYESDQLLLDRSQAQRPLSNHAWTETNSDGKGLSRTVTLRADGWYDYAKQESDGTWTTYSTLLTPLGGGSPLYAYAAYSQGSAVYHYGVLRVFDSTHWRSADPDCSKADDSANATNAGAVSDGTICTFKDSYTLMTALRTYAARPDVLESISH